MRSYFLARIFFSIFGFISLCVVAAGGMIALGGVALAGYYLRPELIGFGAQFIPLIAAIPGALVALIGLLSMAIIQNNRATVDTAELTQQMLKVARDQLEVSKRALTQDPILSPHYAKLAKPTGPASPQASGYDSVVKVDGDIPVKPVPAPLMLADPVVQEQSAEPETLTYKDQSATLFDGKWMMNGLAFSSKESLIKYVDRHGSLRALASTLRAER